MNEETNIKTIILYPDDFKRAPWIWEEICEIVDATPNTTAQLDIYFSDCKIHEYDEESQ